MTGLENIIKQIENESKLRIDEITKKAEADAADIIRNAENEAKGISEDFEKMIKEKTAEIIERGEAADALEFRRSVLFKKQEIIERVLKNAKQELINQEPDGYFEFLEKLLEMYAQNDSGYIVMSEKDKNNITKDFKKALKGHGLEISKDSIGDVGGFVLVYGSIEVNCTFEAIFDAYNEELSDMLNSFLFNSEGGV